MAETTTSFSSDQLNQQIELILDAYGIAPQNGEAKLYDKITALIDTPQKKQQFFDEMVAYKTAQPNLANYQDLYNDALDFSRKQPGNYNKGTYSSTISLVNREKAAAQAYYKNYQNNPVFKLYLQAQGITDFNYMNAAAKDKIIECFNQVTAARDFVVDEYAPTPQDLEWKEEVNAVFMPNCQKLTRAFQRFDTKDDRELRYRLNNSLIYYYDKKHVRIRSESIKDFVLICQTAKDMGNNTITFGAFEKHPEYKAKLYLAALQTGMKMKNQPSLNELRAYPEFTQIQSIIKQKKFEEESRKAWKNQPELRKRAKEYHAELEQANAAANQDPDYRTLKSELFNANKALSNAKKNGADQDTLRQLGENVDEAKRKFNENPSQAAIASAETNFRNTIKEMADNYIKYGSSEKDKTSPNERKEKLKKHLEIYDANTFFTKTVKGRDNKGYPLFEEIESAMELQRKMTDNEKKSLIREQTKNYKEVQTGLREYMRTAGR